MASVRKVSGDHVLIGDSDVPTHSPDPSAVLRGWERAVAILGLGGADALLEVVLSSGSDEGAEWMLRCLGGAGEE